MIGELIVASKNKDHKIISRRETMTTVTYNVPAIHCGHCTHTIEMEVGELQGVKL